MFHARGVLFVIPLLVACSSKWSFEDGDGDGVSPAEGDCWDKEEGPEGYDLKGSDIGPHAVETWYDGFDQDCKGDNDYDADGDGYVPSVHEGKETFGLKDSDALEGGDCWDDLEPPAEGMVGGAEIYPGAPDAWYDGLDSDCGGEDDFDQDGDDFASAAHADDYMTTVPHEKTPEEEAEEALPTTDCEDENTADSLLDEEGVLPGAIHPDAEETWYDGVDQDCGGENDFDQDGDGQTSAAHPDVDGVFGEDCYDGDVDDVIPMEPKLAAIVEFWDITDDELLSAMELTAADIYSGATDTLYDAVDADCGGLEGLDCDADADGAQSTADGPPTCAGWEVVPDDAREVELYEALCESALCENDDCDDSDPSAYPDEDIEEIPYNGVDEDCDFSTGDGDADQDGFWAHNYDELVEDSPLSPGVGEGGDCNDNNR